MNIQCIASLKLAIATMLSLLLAGSLQAITYDMTVAKDGSGNYTTVQNAFNAVPQNSTKPTVIYIKNGTYKEKLTLAKTAANVTIIGQKRDSVFLTYDDYYGKIVSGDTITTSTSASVYINGNGFCALNISFQNSSGPVGQALAISISGDKSIFYNCRFLGRQDTYYADRCRQFVRDCYIEGSTDFIFGPSTAYFDSCSLYSYGGSALTAASTEQYVTYGYVFRYCSVKGAAGVSTALGRPWRPYAAVSFLNCTLSTCINPAGWDNWGDPNNEKTARYSEYKNIGAGASASQRVTWAVQLTDAQAANYTILNVLKTTYANPPVVDNWNPLTTLALYTGSTAIKNLLIDKGTLSATNDFKVVSLSREKCVVRFSGFQKGSAVHIKLYSLQGKIVSSYRSTTQKEFTFNTPHVQGLYILDVSCGDFAKRKTIAIQ